MQISMPPSGARCSWTSSMKLRMRKMPRPLRLQEVFGGQRIGDRLRIEALALVAHANHQLARLAARDRREVDEHVLGRIVAIAVLDGVDDRLADGDTHPVHALVVEAEAAPDVIADHLHEVEHLEGAGEFESDDDMTVWRHGPRLNTIPSVERLSSRLRTGDASENLQSEVDCESGLSRGLAGFRFQTSGLRFSHASGSRRDHHARPPRAGTLRVPGDKSISHRYALLAALAEGASRLSNYAPGADCRSTLACLRRLGVEIQRGEDGVVTVMGRGLRGWRSPSGPLDAGNSGTTMRMLAGVLAAQPFSTQLVGDASLSRRPMRRVIEPLARMGARIEATDGHAPLTIHGAALHAIAHGPTCRARR